MVFIDGSNLYHGLKSETGNAAIDFLKLGQKLSVPDELHTVYYYNAPCIEGDDPERYRHQQRFFENIRKTDGVILKLGRLTRKGNTVVEKGVDIQIAVDMLMHAFQNDYDTAILVSGDGDFSELVSAVTRQGKKVKNAAFRSTRSDALLKVSHTYIQLTAVYVSDCRP